jgi:hypothetical protein
MEDHKNKEVTGATFEEVLKVLHDKNGKIEASFASKLLHTINPKMPIWDQWVMKNVGIARPRYGSANQWQKTIAAYDRLTDWYEKYLQTENAKELISLFDKEFPAGVEITDVNKIDLVLWQMREDEEENT